MKTTAEITAAREELWAAISAVMTRKWGAPQIRRLAREANVGSGTISRMKTGQVACTLDVLVAVAKALYVEPYELLLPPGKQPDELFSPQALDLARSLDQISDQFARAQAYALAMHSIQAVGGAPASQSQGSALVAVPTAGRRPPR